MLVSLFRQKRPILGVFTAINIHKLAININNIYILVTSVAEWVGRGTSSTPEVDVQIPTVTLWVENLRSSQTTGEVFSTEYGVFQLLNVFRFGFHGDVINL